MAASMGNPVRLGNRDRVKEASRDLWHYGFMESAWRDAMHAARRLYRTPGFTIPAVLTLALAIGANAAIFTVVYRVLLNPLPYADSGRLIALDHGAARINTPAGMGMTCRW